ncbi:MAG TPA: pitrilysin family protein [Blastocatellia bacterium]|nr:pitrilysin family protein [Blastocatellia bacterium]
MSNGKIIKATFTNRSAGLAVRWKLSVRPLSAIILVLGLSVAAEFYARRAVAQSFRVPFKQFQLDNGLRVVLSEDHSAPVVAVVLYYDVGSRNEVKGRTGFAHLFEHMMFQGSKNVGKTQQFAYVENNGGVLNGSTHSDFTNYYDLLPSNQLALALWLEADRMRSLAITPENLKNQQEAVKEEKRMRIDNQAYWPALEMMDQMIFKNWANAHPTIGSMEDLDAARVTDVKQFFDIYYAPNNAVLTIAGDISYAEAEELVRKYFTSIPRQKAPPPVDVSEPSGVSRDKAVVDDQHAQVPGVAIAWKIPERRSRDFYAIELLKDILLDGESSRLYQKMVKEKAVSVEIQAFLDERRGPGAFTIFTVHKGEVKSEEVQALIEEEIERIKAEGVPEKELSKVKNQLRLSRFTEGGDEGEHGSLQAALGRALGLAEHTLFDGDPSLINSEIDRYLAVTADQIKNAARKYFVAENRSVVYIRPAPKAKPAGDSDR